MDILGERMKSRPQSRTRIVSAGASPRQSKFKKKRTRKGKSFAQFLPESGAKGHELRASSREAAKEYSPQLALSLSKGRQLWVKT